jgi:hypothetical protein
LQKLTQSCTLTIDDYNVNAIWIGPFDEEILRMAASPPRKKRKPAAKSTRDGRATEAADFIAEHLIDLAVLARRHKLDLLGFVLDMGLMEAKKMVRLGGKRPRKV